MILEVYLTDQCDGLQGGLMFIKDLFFLHEHA